MFVVKRCCLDGQVFPFFEVPGCDDDPDAGDVGQRDAGVTRQWVLLQVDALQRPARLHRLDVHVWK